MAHTLVVLEGQQHQIPSEIAASDELLLKLFGSINPALAQAEIKRSATQVELIARKGSKGTGLGARLAQLDAEPMGLDPATCAHAALQYHEFWVGIDAENASEISGAITRALAVSCQQQQHRRTTLRRLHQAPGVSTLVVGF